MVGADKVMTRPFRRTIRRQLRDLWRQSDKSKGRYEPARTVIEYLRDQFGLDAVDPKNDAVLNWLLIIDEFTLCYYLVGEYIPDLIHHSAGLEIKDMASCLKIMFSGLVAQLNCLRIIVTKGFDVQARGLNREIGEQIDTIMFICAKPEMSAVFRSCANEQDANAFWHKFVSKGKMRIAIEQKMLSDHPHLASYVDDFSKFRMAEIFSYSMIAHPSYIASFMSTYMGSSFEGPLRGHLGVVDSASNRTLSYTFFRLFEMHLFCLSTMEKLVDFFSNFEARAEMKDVLEQRIHYVGLIGTYVALQHENLPLDRYVEPDMDLSDG